jgi:hypothetical protein
MEGSGYNAATQPQDAFKPISIRQPSRPPMTRSYGSSSGSSASTLLTPRDPHSWVSSTHSPSFMETSDSIPTSCPYQLHLLPSTKFAKDISLGDFPTYRDFRFPSVATSNSPSYPESEWCLDEHTEAMTLPVYPYPGHVEVKRSKRARPHAIHHKALKVTSLPGLGIISPDGRYNEGTTIPSKLRARHGPLTLEQRNDAALIRRHGACRDCRKRKIKV